MFVETILVNLLAYGALASPQNVYTRHEERVVGGEAVKLGEIPYIISLKRNGIHECGGSILDARHVLTAAHCVDNSEPRNMQIQYGIIDLNSKENLIQVKKIQYHEKFNRRDIVHDVAVLTLEEDIAFGPNVKPTILPSGPFKVKGKSVVSRISGWGETASGGDQRYLLSATSPLFNDEICSRKLEEYEARYNVCAGDLDGSRKICSGDSGGPLYAEGAQQGIASWVYGCISKDEPGVFTKVANYLHWIKKAMED